MFNNQFSGMNPYNPAMFGAPMGQMNQIQQPQPPQQQVVRVNGQPGADAYRMAPNSSVLLLDESAPIVWLKTTDGAGYATLTPYQITPYQPENPQDIYKSLEARIQRLEGMINAKSDIAEPSRTEQPVPATGTD